MDGERAFHFVHPGPVSQMSGGTLYDIRVIDELRQSGWRIELHELRGRFPLADEATKARAAGLLSTIPSGETVVVDGLALPAFEMVLEQARRRLAMTALVHHPTADEAGLTGRESTRLFDVEKRLFATLRRIVVPSPAMVRRLGDYGVPPDRVDVALPGVEPAQRARGSNPGAVELLCVASLTPRKGHLSLLDALSCCIDLDWRLTCAGPTDSDADLTLAVTHSIEKLGLSDRVDLVGTQVGADLERLYAGADAFVLASRYEGYGMAFAEAMARGLPIVASGEGAVAETVPETAGIVVPVDDPGALSGALRRMIADPDFRRTKADGAWVAGQSLPRWTDTAARFAQAVVAAGRS